MMQGLQHLILPQIIVQTGRRCGGRFNYTKWRSSKDNKYYFDLVDGYEFKLNSTTSSAASIIASIDSNAAFNKAKEFVDTFNSVNSAIDQLTNKALMVEKEILARDVVFQGLREIRSLVTSLFQVLKIILCIYQNCIKTERDGSLSLLKLTLTKHLLRTNSFDVMIFSG